MTQLQSAWAGDVTAEMEEAARAERVSPRVVRERIAEGTAVLPANRLRTNRRNLVIGKGFRVKVNANLGTSLDYADLSREIAKLEAAEEAKADAVMDLSTGGDIREIRKTLLAKTSLTFGTVPIYECGIDAVRETGSIMGMTGDGMLEAVRRHAEDGVDFVTVHSGVTREVCAGLDGARRVCHIVSRGGAFLAEWMKVKGEENPYYARFDEVLEIAKAFDVTLSLGDGLRPGAIADAMDGPQVHELMVLAGLARRAREEGVQVMIEGPGHVPLHQIRAQVELEKELCEGAPFYVLGPLVTDISPGYDHIVSAIGGALAAWAGADFLCYVTPSEHLSLPDAQQVREGVIAARIAGHAADIARGIPGARETDLAFSRMRRARDWKGMIENALDPQAARAIREKGKPSDDDVCSMCGPFCPFKLKDAKASKKG
ncbi:MAG: phosphomethylpyrimidine synthase ThiC [Planctomycetota bacterium]|jgi:phosphomethylpyrimidine synthase